MQGRRVWELPVTMRVHGRVGAGPLAKGNQIIRVPSGMGGTAVWVKARLGSRHEPGGRLEW